MLSDGGCGIAVEPEERRWRRSSIGPMVVKAAALEASQQRRGTAEANGGGGHSVGGSIAAPVA